VLKVILKHFKNVAALTHGKEKAAIEAIDRTYGIATSDALGARNDE
jgi:hypothetical protein